MDVLSSATGFLAGLGGTVLLLVPGYVLGKTFSRGVRGPELSDQAFIATAAAGGMVTHAIALPFTVPIVREFLTTYQTGESAAYVPIAIWAVAVLLIVPATMGALAARVADTKAGPVHSILSFYGMSFEQRTADAWNWTFGGLSRDGTATWLQVRLKNGAGAYLGLFGGNSLISSDARVRDVYLERTWDLDTAGKPSAANTPNKGVWISGDEISSIEIFPLKEAPRGK